MAYSYNRLWKLLIDRKMIRTEMRKQVGISTNILAKIGIALGCILDDIVEISADTAAGGKANGKE